MNTELLFESLHYPILILWLTNGHRTNAEISEALYLVKSQHFKDWYACHPKGTMEQYLEYREQQIIAYRNSPEYQIQSLQEQIEELNTNITELREEIQEQNDVIEGLNASLSQSRTFSLVLGFVSLSLLLLLFRKYIAKLFKKRANNSVY